MGCKLRRPSDMFRVFWNETSSFWEFLSCLGLSFSLIVGTGTLVYWINEDLDILLLKVLAVGAGIVWALIFGLIAWCILLCAWDLVKKVMCEDDKDVS